VDLPAPPLPRLSEPTAGWRRTAFIASIVAAVELVALIVVALAFIAKPFAGSPDKPAQAAASTPASGTTSADSKPAAATSAQAPTPAHEAPAAARLPRTKTRVLVLNGNGFAGAASQMAAVVRARLYPVSGVGDAARRDFPRTIVMYRSGFRGEGERLAKDLGLARNRAIALDGMRPSDLHGAHLVVVVGNAS
jgi:LytR cell envelope-related transcriptional attenuator